MHKKIYENEDYMIIAIDTQRFKYNFLAIIKNSNFNQYDKIVEELNKLKEKQNSTYNEIIVDNLFSKDSRYYVIYFADGDNGEILYHNIVMNTNRCYYTEDFKKILKYTTTYYLDN